MKLRTVVFWLHLTAGLVAGTIVLVMSVTGVLLAFERELTEWAERDLLHKASASESLRLSLDEIIARFRANEPDATIRGVNLRSEPAAPVALNLGPERSVYVNPTTGELLGEGAQGTRAFFRGVTNIHRWLGASDAKREVGRAITGACNLAFLFLVVSGSYLWWPRQWTKSRGRAIIFPKFELRGRSRDFHWHNAVGFWSAPFLFFIVLSGVVMSYPWATNVLYHLTNSQPPPVRPAARRPGSEKETSFIPPELERLCQIASGLVPDWQTVNVRFEASADAPLTFSIAQGRRGRPDLRTQVTLDPKSGEVVRTEAFSDFNRGRRLRTWARFVHTGEAGGAIGQTIAALVSAGGAVLVCTGFALAWRRFRGRKLQLA